jgi:predicted Rossmann-fold nucleotide-binding protein
MNAMPKVLVVDSGERAPDGALSVELAGMGYASVTTPFEAADDVLALMPSPAAVVLQMPLHADWAERKRFLDLARRLRRNLADSGTPVIITGGANGAATMLQNELSVRVAAAPDL